MCKTGNKVFSTFSLWSGFFFFFFNSQNEPTHRFGVFRSWRHDWRRRVVVIVVVASVLATRGRRSGALLTRLQQQRSNSLKQTKSENGILDEQSAQHPRGGRVGSRDSPTASLCLKEWQHVVECVCGFKTGLLDFLLSGRKLTRGGKTDVFLLATGGVVELEDVQNGLRILFLLRLADVGRLEETGPLLRHALHTTHAVWGREPREAVVTQCVCLKWKHSKLFGFCFFSAKVITISSS